MRLILLLALVVVAVAALIQGIKLLWRAAFPTVEVEEEVAPAWIERREGKLLLGLLALIFILMAALHLLEERAPLPQRYEPPRMEGGKIVPGRFE